MLKDGTQPEDRRLDRVFSGHTTHLDRYPLTTDTMPAERQGMPMGINWYSNFDHPLPIQVRSRTWQTIGRGTPGSIRGGHCTCLIRYGVIDPVGWWEYYDQGFEGRCVEFGTLRALSLHNRKRYDITSRWLYWEAQRRDYWPGGEYPGAAPRYEGTSVDAGMQVIAQLGAIPARRGGLPITPEEAPALANPAEGISAYRWARDWDIVRQAMQVPDWLPGVPMLNSWGKNGYPHKVLVLDDIGPRLINEDGEFALMTDR